MYQRLSKLRERRAAGESGFTLIELLVVVVIIGILIAIAIPVYLNYQKGAKDKSADSDLRNAISVLEQCNSDNSGYPSAIALSGSTYIATGATTNPCTQTMNVSSGTTFVYFVSTVTPNTFNMTSSNSGGSGKTYCYVGAKGGSVTSTSITLPITATTATC